MNPQRFDGDPGLEIKGLYYDSRQVQPGGLFFALKGLAADGHRFIADALQAGAAAIVAEDEAFVPSGANVIVVADSRQAMSSAAAAFYGDPTATVPLVGITGTNGKTTTTYLVESILEHAGRPTAVLGTINYRFRELSYPAPNTTPESVDLQRTLRDMVDAGAGAIVMEVSSHALEQRRVDGCHFDVGVFTNLTRDHLDYHLTMEAYLGSKMRLFRDLLVGDRAKPRRCAVVNNDDPYGSAIAGAAACPVIGFGLGEGAAVTATNVKFSVDGIEGVLVTPAGRAIFSSPLLGRFNLSNILAAASVGIALDLPLDAIRRGIEEHRRVPGRLERVDNDRGITVLVDYAHTDDALDNVLSTMRKISTGRIITLFGCGGDRDQGKRPVMGRIAAEMSDLVLVTSDNPRTEEPSAILDQIKAGIVPLGVREYRLDEVAAGCAEKGFIICPSRRDAIRLAASVARPGDIVLLAGKGHEDYQIIGTVKHHFDDREEAAAAFR
jgi:UDP-N-acetylmuramoyl-L-alanyl-D-glutamate--2,6-diaminopimelate ligase